MAISNRILGAWCAGVSLIAVASTANAQSAPPPAVVDQAAADTASAENPDDKATNDIVVTGSRLNSAGFSAPTPVTVVNSAIIQERAPANIADVLNEQPAFRISQSDTTRNNSGFPTSAQNLLDLRALGPTRTLTLINGHRAVGTNWQGTVDTNIVPVGLVERVDVVTGGASAAYGSDAVAGVVNIVLREKMQGISGTAQTGFTEFGSGQQYTADLAGGTGFADDRGHIIAGIDFNKSNAITNVYGTKFGAAEITQIQPTAAQRAAGGLPQNVVTTGVEPGTSAPGGLLYQGAVGGGAYTFNSSGNPVPFSQGRLDNGQFMTGSTANYGYNIGNVAPLRNPSSRIDAYSRVSYDITNGLTLFAEGNYSHNKSGPFKTQDVILGNGSNIPALTISTSNPFVTPATLALLTPGTTTFKIGRINTEYGGQFTSQTIDTHRIVLGLKGSFLTDWTWEAYVQSGRTTLHLKRDDLNFSAMQKAVNGCTDTSTGLSALQQAQNVIYEQLTGLQCVPYNPFGVGRTPNAATNYFNYHTTQDENIGQDVAAASLSGSPFSLPAGKVQFAAGAEIRREKIAAVSDPVSRLGTILTSNLVQFSGQYTVKEGFAELGVPVFKDQPFAKSLDLNAAARVTDYSLSGTVTTWKFGFTWEPTDFLRFRATRSRDIRAPNLFDIFLVGGAGPITAANHIPAGVVGANGTVNTFAGSAAAPNQPLIQIGSGGGTSGNLKPEVAETSTAGIVVQFGGFHASVDYYHVALGGAIVRPAIQQVIDLCRDGVVLQCQNITFDSSVAGGISQVVARSTNLNTTTVSGFDFEMAYHAARPFGLAGNLTMRALANYGLHNKTFTPLNGLTEEDINILNGQPKFSYNLNLGYEVNRLDFNLQLRGFTARRGNPVIYNADGTLSSNTILGPEDAGYVVTNNNTININHYPGQLIVSPSVTFRLTGKVSMFLNVDNLLNVGPPPLAISNVYDLIGRRYRFGIRFRGL